MSDGRCRWNYPSRDRGRSVLHRVVVVVVSSCQREAQLVGRPQRDSRRAPRYREADLPHEVIRQQRVHARRALDRAAVAGVGDLHVARARDRAGQGAPERRQGDAIVGGGDRPASGCRRARRGGRSRRTARPRAAASSRSAAGRRDRGRTARRRSSASVGGALLQVGVRHHQPHEGAAPHRAGAEAGAEAGPDDVGGEARRLAAVEERAQQRRG